MKKIKQKIIKMRRRKKTSAEITASRKRKEQRRRELFNELKKSMVEAVQLKETVKEEDVKEETPAVV